MNVPPYPKVPQLSLRLVTLNRSLFPSAEPATLCSDPFLLLALPFPPPPSLVRSNRLKENIHKTGTMLLPMTSLNNFSSTRPAVEVLPRSRILGRAHFPRPALKTKMIRFWVRDVLYWISNLFLFDSHGRSARWYFQALTRHLGEPSISSLVLVFIDPYSIQSHLNLPSPCFLFYQRLKNCCCL